MKRGPAAALVVFMLAGWPNAVGALDNREVPGTGGKSGAGAYRCTCMCLHSHGPIANPYTIISPIACTSLNGRMCNTEVSDGMIRSGFLECAGGRSQQGGGGTHAE